MIFQDPMTSLNPTMKIGRQVTEALRHHSVLSASAARARAIELLERVQIPDARSRVDRYPFELSGGMRQRVMIAMAIACDPKILIADEPTTALDVTVQAQILDLLEALQREQGMAIVLITHDLGVVARPADDVAVMYAGQIVERATVDDLFGRPAHPYTLGLRQSMPRRDERARRRLEPIEGSPPDLFSPPAGCAYADRCPWAMKGCARVEPPLWEVAPGHLSRCWLHHASAAARRPAALFTGAVMTGEALP
jgi:oligopeptide/dipeptide ABC transporter ATP-binding protein